MTFDEARAQFPVLERYAYLNAGTNGPLARATVEALTAQAEHELEEGRSGRPQFDALLEARETARRELAAVIGSIRRSSRSSTRPRAAAAPSSPASGSVRTTRSSSPTRSISA
jgi:hypothetical protein